MKENDNDLPTSKKLNLVDETGAGTKIHLDVLINDTEDLVMEGYDLGEIPERFFGDEDYEYWVTVRKEHKDWLLLNLMQEVFARESKPSSAFMEWLKEREIPYEFSSY